MPWRPTHDLPLVWVLAAVAAVKIAILLLNGPSVQWDSGDYINYADAILDHGRAFASAGWGAKAVPLFIFRPPGYPLVLAGAKWFAPANFMTVVVILQGLVDGIAMCLMFAVSTRLLRSAWAAATAVAVYAGSTSILWDNSILSDSLYGSLWNIVIFALVGVLIGRWRLDVKGSLALGLLWGASLWMRDVGLYFTPLPGLLIVATAASGAVDWRRASANLLAFLAAVSVMVGVIVLLNQHRTGDAVYSITGVENWLRPAFDMDKTGDAQPFADDGLVSRIVRETMIDHGFEDQMRVIAAIHQRCQCTPPELQHLLLEKYLATVKRHPLAFARYVARNFNYFALSEVIADPFATFNQFLELGASRADQRLPGFSLRHLAELVRDFSAAKLLLMVLSALGEIVSATLFTGYLLGTPYLLLRRVAGDGMSREEIALAFLWVSFVGVVLAFSLVHFEARFALSVLPAAAIGLVHVWRRIAFSRQWLTHATAYPPNRWR